MNTTDQRFYHIFVGTYGSAESDAIERLLFDSHEGTLEKIGKISGIENPSFVTVNQEGNVLYSVSEKESGEVVCIDIDFSNGELTEKSRQSTKGDSPCFISLNPDGQWLFTANYGSGNATVHPITDDGNIAPLCDRKCYSGHSIVPNRQESSHPHAIINIPGTDVYVVTDLGTDRLYFYKFDNKLAKLILINEVRATVGSGPRHIAIHPTLQILYVANELHSSISVYSYDSSFKEIVMVQQVGTIPLDFNEPNYGADIHISPSATYLYVSNRGHHSITTYKIGGDGKLEKIDIASTEGEWPRNFTIIPNEKYILVANEHTNSIVVMEIANNGSLVATGHVYSINNPVCLKVVNRG